MTTTAVRDTQVVVRAASDPPGRHWVPSTAGRRKQHCPKRVFDGQDDDDQPGAPDLCLDITGALTESSMDKQRYDNFICGQCCAEFYSLPSFLAHKKVCNSEWPVLIPLDGNGANPSAGGENPVEWQLAINEAPATVKSVSDSCFQAKCDDLVPNSDRPRPMVTPASHGGGATAAAAGELFSNGYVGGMVVGETGNGALASLVQIQSALAALQQQQMQQTHLIHQMYRQIIGEKPSSLLDQSKDAYLSHQQFSSAVKQRLSGGNALFGYPTGHGGGSSAVDIALPSYGPFAVNFVAKQQQQITDSLRDIRVDQQQRMEAAAAAAADNKDISKRSRDRRAAQFWLPTASAQAGSEKRTQLWAEAASSHQRPSRNKTALVLSRPHSCPQPIRDETPIPNAGRSFISVPGSPFDMTSLAASSDACSDLGQARSDSQATTHNDPLLGAPMDLNIAAESLQSAAGQLFCPLPSSQQKSHSSIYGTPGAYDCLPSVASPFASADGNLLSSVIGNEVDDDWESMMEITASDEAEKIRKLVGEGCAKVTDPNQCVICKRVLSCKSALQMHYRTHTGERPFKCKICQRAFTTKGNLKTHMGVHRTKPAFRIFHQCPECHKKFTNAVVLQQHLRSHGPRAVQLFSDKLLATADFQSSPTGLFQKTTAGDMVTAGVPRFGGQDGDLGSGSGMMEGKSAAAAGAGPAEGSPSLRMVAGQEQMVLPEVGPGSAFGNLCFMPVEQAGGPAGTSQRLGTASTLILPSGTGGMSSAMLLGGQQGAFIGAAGEPSPVVTFPGRPSTTCNICFKSFACQSALEIHYRSHTKERPFKCHICSRGFSTKGNMKQHLLTHKVRQLPVGEASASRQTSVGDSDKTSCDGACSPGTDGSAGEARAHSDQMVNGDQKDPSPLESIQRMWSQAETLATSNNVTTMCATPRRSGLYSKHQCQLCCKHFSSASALQIHMRTHTGDKPFKCTICERAFTTKGNLKVHMGTHMWSSSGQRGRRIFDSSLSPLPCLLNPGGSVEELMTGSRESQSIGSSSMVYDSSGSVEDLRKEPQPCRGAASTPGDVAFDRVSSSEDVKSPGQSSPAPKTYGSFAAGLTGNYVPSVFTSTGFPLATPSAAAAAGLNLFSSMAAAGELGPNFFQNDVSGASGYMSSANARGGEPQTGAIQTVVANGVGGVQGANVEALLRAWQNICYICHKSCPNSADLEDHLKTHLMQNNVKVSGTVQVD